MAVSAAQQEQPGFPQGAYRSTTSGTLTPEQVQALMHARPVPAKLKQPTVRVRPFSQYGVAIRATSLGAGIDVATTLSQSVNLRLGGNFFSYTGRYNVDGVTYSGTLNFESGEAKVDYFPFHNGLHVSGGVLTYSNHVDATASVPPGQMFSLGDQEYTNSITNPAAGSSTLAFQRRVAPTLTIGYGNIIPRNGSHWTIPFEAGLAYMGAPVIDITLQGTACTTQGCFNLATDPMTQQNLQQEIATLNEDIKRLKLYPIVSIGVGYRFGGGSSRKVR